MKSGMGIKMPTIMTYVHFRLNWVQIWYYKERGDWSASRVFCP
jgi:hypothetical protein